MDGINWTKGWLSAVALSIICFLPSAASALAIDAGDDFLKTLPGSFVDIGFSPIDLIGNGNTVVRRLQDAECPMSGVGGVCEVVALSLMRVDPIDINGTFFDLHIDKDPTKTTPDSP